MKFTKSIVKASAILALTLIMTLTACGTPDTTNDIKKLTSEPSAAEEAEFVSLIGTWRSSATEDNIYFEAVISDASDVTVYQTYEDECYIYFSGSCLTEAAVHSVTAFNLSPDDDVNMICPDETIMLSFYPDDDCLFLCSAAPGDDDDTAADISLFRVSDEYRDDYNVTEFNESETDETISEPVTNINATDDAAENTSEMTSVEQSTDTAQTEEAAAADKNQATSNVVSTEEEPAAASPAPATDENVNAASTDSHTNGTNAAPAGQTTTTTTTVTTYTTTQPAAQAQPESDTYVSGGFPLANYGNCNGQYLGRLRIPAVGVNVAIYNTNSQAVNDADDSACFFFSGSPAECVNYTVYATDHAAQGFEAIKQCGVGTALYIDGADGNTYKYVCDRVDYNGRNDTQYIYDSGGNNLMYTGGLWLYTCNDEYSVSITLLHFTAA